MRVLLTGGAGYIGSILARILLEKGYNVTCLDRFFFGMDSIKDIAEEIRVVKADVRWFDPAILKDIDAVFDLASLSNDPSGELDPAKTMEINYKGRVRVANLAKKYGAKKYVLASSCSVYGFQECILTEESGLNPLTTYAKASANAEKEILPLADKEFCATVVRQATVYGLSPRMRFDLAINGIPIMRDGKQWRPFVHVKDTSNAFIKILESAPELVNGQVFNVGSNDQNVQIFDLAQTVAKAMNISFKYEWYGSTDTRSYRVSFDKIKKRLGYKTSFMSADGAKEVYNALQTGILNPDDPRTITVKWYKSLLESQALIRSIELNGVIL
jgi:nucleoside-diphosphate-sugar epimerase